MEVDFLFPTLSPTSRRQKHNKRCPPCFLLWEAETSFLFDGAVTGLRLLLTGRTWTAETCRRVQVVDEGHAHHRGHSLSCLHDTYFLVLNEMSTLKNLEP